MCFTQPSLPPSETMSFISSRFLDKMPWQLFEMGERKIQKALDLLVFTVAVNKLQNYSKLWGRSRRYADMENVHYMLEVAGRQGG